MRVIARPSAKAFLNLSRQAEQRFETLKEYVCSEIAEQFAERVKSNAPNDNVLPGYKEGIAPVKIEDTNNIAVIAKNPQVEKKAEEVRDGFSALYVKNSGAKEDKLFLILKNFEPYTIDTFPISKLPENITLEYKQITENEYSAIRNNVIYNLTALSNLLKGIGYEVKDISNEQTLIEDLTFRVLRGELKLNDIPPHWGPAITNNKNYQLDGGAINSIVSLTSDLKKYTNIVDENVSKEEISDINRFKKVMA